MTDIATRPDLAAIKQRQQATWASGDYQMIGTQILLSSELLIEALDVHAGEYVPALLEHARMRAAAEG